jgi:hypothetical protein
VIGLLAAAVAAAVVLVAGGFPGRVTAAGVVGRFAGSFLAGAVALHLGLTLADRLGLAWSRPMILVLALLAAALWRVHGEGARGVRLDRPAPGWGLLAGALPVAVFAGLAAVHLAHTPDFVFHWGTKAARWVAERGVDAALFAGDSGWRLNPGYPQLVPELMALPGLLFGGWVERAALLVGPAVATVSLLAWRHAARAAGVAGFELEVGTALAGSALGGFGFVHGAAGGADGVVAFALLAGVAALVLRDRPGALPTLALAAALAAAAKTEGVTVAVLLLAVDAAVTLDREGPRSAASRLLRTAPAGIAVVALWWSFEGRFYLPNRASWPDLDRLGRVAEAIVESAMRPEAGFQWIFLFALPWCFTRRALRAPAFVITAQAVTFLVAFVVEPIDSGFLVVTTMPRLVSQLVPAVLLLTVLRGAEASLGFPGFAGGKISS